MRWYICARIDLGLRKDVAILMADMRNGLSEARAAAETVAGMTMKGCTGWSSER
jgi:hypothetical protein